MSTEITRTVRRRDLDIFSKRLGQNGNQDLNLTYGYAGIQERTFELFFNAYRESGLAHRIISSAPRSCWRDVPVIEQGENKILENDIKKLKKIGLFKQLEKADILNRIGRFAVLYIGLPDSKDLTEPVQSVAGISPSQVYFQPYHENSVEVVNYEDDILNPRFGKPKIYQLSFNKIDVNSQDRSNLQTLKVHWTRVVHLAEGSLDNDFDGLPYLEPVYNRLQDWNKTAGGSAQAYFNNASNLVVLEVDKEFSGELTKDEIKKVKDEIKDFQELMERFALFSGVNVKPIHTPHHDPKETGMMSIREISSYSGMPIRMLIGEGGGQLAGSEDKATYNAMILERQNSECTLWFNQALDVLRRVGLFPEIPDDAEIVWPVAESVTEVEKANINKTKAETVKIVSDAAGSQGGLSGTLEPKSLIEQLTDIKIDDPDDGGDLLDDIEEKDLGVVLEVAPEAEIEDQGAQDG